MKILAALLCCLLYCFTVFADQQTTVLTQKGTIGKTSVSLPYIDGSNNEDLEKEANRLIKEFAAKLSKEVGGQIYYEVTLNRPSLVSVLLTAVNGSHSAYKALNLDLTTGREFGVTDFFVDNEEVQQVLGDYNQVLFAEEGVYLRKTENSPYSDFVPYGRIITSMRIGEAGRIMQIAKLTANVEGKILNLGKNRLLALKLDANPSTGYGWHMSCNSDALSEVGSSFTIPRGNPDRKGTPGTEILLLAVKEPGTYNVRMEYRRSWEKMNLQSFTFTIIAQ